MYGPHPTVWAVFLFFNALFGIAFFFISILGFAKRNLNLDASILWALPFIFAALVIIYIAAQIGHKLGDKQTHIIHDYFEKSIGVQVPI